MIELHNGDCLEIMNNFIAMGKKVDAIITDPPYILTPHGGVTQGLADRSCKVRDEIEFMANGFDYESAFNKFLNLTDTIVLFCSNLQLGKFITFFESQKYKVDVLVWSKTNPCPLCNGKYISDIEYILYVHTKGSIFNNDSQFDYKKKVKRYSIITNKMNKVHPTQKPESLMRELVSVHSYEGSTVLDPFMGSGSTGVVCKDLNRNFIGIELDKNYFDIAEKRIKEVNEHKQLELF